VTINLNDISATTSTGYTDVVASAFTDNSSALSSNTVAGLTGTTWGGGNIGDSFTNLPSFPTFPTYPALPTKPQDWYTINEKWINNYPSIKPAKLNLKPTKRFLIHQEIGNILESCAFSDSACIVGYIDAHNYVIELRVSEAMTELQCFIGAQGYEVLGLENPKSLKKEGLITMIEDSVKTYLTSMIGSFTLADEVIDIDFTLTKRKE